jgi:hypothetical protein
MKHCLLNVWGIYHSRNSIRIDEKLEHGKFIKELAVEKRKLERKHASLLEEVRSWADGTGRKVMQKNYQKIKSGEHDEIEQLGKEVAELKQVQKTQADMMKANKMDWEKERQQVKEEKRKVEYAMYDLVQVNSVNKDKVERITAICNE